VPENDQPMWPSSDEDSTSGTAPEQGGEGDATAHLPIPNPSPPAGADGRTVDLAVPKITQPEEKTSWFRPNVPAVPPPLAPPPQPSQQRQQQQQQPDQRPEPPRNEQQRPEQQRPEQQRPEQQRSEPERPEQRPDQQRPEQRSGQQQQRPDQHQQQSLDQRRGQQQQRQEQRPDQQQRPDQPSWSDQHQQQRPDHRQPPPREQQPLARRLPQIPAAPHAVPMRIEPTGEQHPAEATTGADRDRPETRPPESWDDAEAADAAAPVDPPTSQEPPFPVKPKRKRRGLLIGAFALLLVVALGVAAALPQVSNRLQLPWAPNKPQGDAPQPVAVSLAMHAPDASAPVPTADGVAKVLGGPAASAAFDQLTGSVVDAQTGAVLWDRNSGQALTPASTTKLLTVAAALLTVDHGAQVSTKVVQGAQPGTVILVGGGDPTLNSLPDGKDSLYTGAAHLDDLVAQVKAATGGKVQKVQLDVSLYKGPSTAPGWAPEDAPSTYGAPIVPVMLDGGRMDPNNDHVMRVATPALTAVQQLAQRLGAQAQPGLVTAPKDAKVLGEVKSAPLTELVNGLLQISDDTLAETVGRFAAIENGAEGSFAGAAKNTMDVLTKNGFDLTGVQLSDGSGLSTLNKIPAKVLSQILAVAAGPDGKDPRTAQLRPLLGGLPVAGGSGTLADRYGDAASSPGKGWLRAKTGTLSGVNTLAGVVLDTDGRVLVFTLMSAGGNTTNARAGLDDVAAALRGCGCR
jgi:D-alanyl-D-alanine carboxypeptidase/D-alanyl-D-alanine-endopeptidase (penicillin-binding protein 4)